jgi:hypothetical protein
VKTGADEGKTRNLITRKQKLDWDSRAENEQNSTGFQTTPRTSEITKENRKPQKSDSPLKP